MESPDRRPAEGRGDTMELASEAPARAAAGFEEYLADIQAFLAKDLFFIGAVPKSGSTWLQTMLNAHPDIACNGESHLIDHFRPLLRTAMTKHNERVHIKNTNALKEFRPFPTFDDGHFRFFIASAIAMLVTRAGEGRQVRLIGEKTPENIKYFTLLESLFPRAKFVQIVRDGRDCAVSAWFHNLRTAPPSFLTRFPTIDAFADNFARLWTQTMSVGIRFRMAHPERCVIVRYEDLLLRQHGVLGALLTFLGADASDAAVRHCIAESDFRKMSGGRIRGEENRESFMRQGQSGDWRNHLSAEANAAFLATAGRTMRRLGYREE